MDKKDNIGCSNNKEQGSKYWRIQVMGSPDNREKFDLRSCNDFAS